MERLRTLEQLVPLPTAGELLAQKRQPLVAIAPAAAVAGAIALMKEKDIGFLPVLEGATLVGVLSERDIARSAGERRVTFVRDIMTTRVHAVPPDAKLPECLGVMDRERIRHLPVVSDGAVQGVLSVRDLTSTAIERHERLLRKLEDERLIVIYPYSSSY